MSMFVTTLINRGMVQAMQFYVQAAATKKVSNADYLSG